jgi:hypothetical protein
MGMVVERWCPTQSMLGVLLMKKVFLAGVPVQMGAARITLRQGIRVVHDTG